ncbi:hypothetical protein [Shewanella baltica]|uniref:hypothetical protein n=1 Tax=Shewanella baltica TaxID=62322 RepID=UPI001EE65751|nr:hypothetical protein [Shewanella baltica]
MNTEPYHSLLPHPVFKNNDYLGVTTILTQGAASHGYYSDLETVIFPHGVKSCGSVIFGDSSAVARKLVLNEDYLFVGPRPMFLAPHHKDLISIIPIKDRLPEGHYSLIFPRNKKLTPAALNLVNEIRFAYFDFIKSHS